MEKFIAHPVQSDIVLMATWTLEAVSLGRYSSLLVMTLGKIAYSLCLASVSLPRRDSRRRMEQDLCGNESQVQGWYISFPFEAAERLMDSSSWFLAPVTK